MLEGQDKAQGIVKLSVCCLIFQHFHTVAVMNTAVSRQYMSFLFAVLLSFLLCFSPSISFPLSQIDSSELIRSRELVARSLSTLRASLPPNTVYIYQPLQSQTTLQQDPTVPSCTLGMSNGDMFVGVGRYYCICEKRDMKPFVAPKGCGVSSK